MIGQAGGTAYLIEHVIAWRAFPADHHGPAGLQIVLTSGLELSVRNETRSVPGPGELEAILVQMHRKR